MVRLNAFQLNHNRFFVSTREQSRKTSEDTSLFWYIKPVADPDLELRVAGGGEGRGGSGLDSLALLPFFPSVISSFFTENKGGRLGPRPLP